MLLNIFKLYRLRYHLLECVFDKLLGISFFEVAHLVFIVPFPNLTKCSFELGLLFVLLGWQNRLLVLADDFSMVDNVSGSCGTSIFVKSSWVQILSGRRSSFVSVSSFIFLSYLSETDGGIKFDYLLLFAVEYDQVITT